MMSIAGIIIRIVKLADDGHLDNDTADEVYEDVIRLGILYLFMKGGS